MKIRPSKTQKSSNMGFWNLIQRLKTEKLVKTFKSYNNFWPLDQILKTRITWSLSFERRDPEKIFFRYSQYKLIDMGCWLASSSTDGPNDVALTLQAGIFVFKHHFKVIVYFYGVYPH